jgi:hypothetical protein
VNKMFKPGYVLGVVAVVLAMSGGAAASTLITSAKIKDGTVQSRDVKKGTLKRDRLSADVQSSLARADRSGTTVQGSPLAGGAKGDTGAKGDGGTKGDKGETGPSGLQGAFYSVAYYDAGDTNEGAIATVACDADNAASQGYIAVSGGVQTIGVGDNTPVSSSFPGRMDWNTNTPKADRLDGWIVQFAGAAGKAPHKVKVWALCVKKTADVPVKQTYTQTTDG